MALNCVRVAYDLFESPEWKVEKVTNKGDTIRSTQRDKMGKIYRLTVSILFNLIQYNFIWSLFFISCHLLNLI